MKKSIRTALVSGAALVAVGAGSAVAGAAVAGNTFAANTIHGCVSGKTRVLQQVYTNPANGTAFCPPGSFKVQWTHNAQQGPPGVQGDQGVQGIQGEQGPPGSDAPAQLPASFTMTYSGPGPQACTVTGATTDPGGQTVTCVAVP